MPTFDNRFRAAVVMPGVLVALLFLALLQACARADNKNLIVQTTPTDCGPAALATLLHYYLGIPTSEAEMVRLTGATPAIGTTLLGLQKAAEAKDCAADSFRMTYQTLQKQLSTFSAPVIVNLVNAEPHFALVLEAGEEFVFLADPAFGNVVLRKKEFLRYWTSAVTPAATQPAAAPQARSTPTVETPAEPEGYVFVAVSEDTEAGRKLRQEMVQRLKRQVRNLQTTRPSTAVFRR